MVPGLLDGDGVVAVRTRRATAGQRRVFRHPLGHDMWLIKRVASVDEAAGTMMVSSDNAEATRADSRSFGAVEIDGSYRVVLRVRGRR